MSSAPSGMPVRRREIFGWAMFDFANSSYTTIIVTVAFSLFFTRLVAPADSADVLWGIAILISNAIVVVLSPLVGAVADDSGRKKLFLFASYACCVTGTAALALAGPGSVALAMALFVVSNLAFSFGENFAGAFLPELSTPATIGRISGLGWGLGYFGGLASLLLVRPLLAGGFVEANIANLRKVWLLTAAFFLVAALPTFLLLRERAARGPRRGALEYARVGFMRVAATARAIGEFRELVRFLGCFFLFTAGLTTVISFAAIYAERTLAFTPGELVRLFILLQVSAAGGALAFGFVQDTLGAARTVRVTLLLWVAVCAAAWAVTTKSAFWWVAMAAGLGMGSLQSASRAMVGLFSPRSKEGEFFGFWGLAGKAAYAVGPPVFGAVASGTGSQRVAILTTGLFFVLGLAGMRFVDEGRGRAAAEAWREEQGRAGG
ncbi:MAG: MFS transporter [Acidobacteriota bacterium]